MMASSLGGARTGARRGSVVLAAIKRKAPKQIAVSRTITSKPNFVDRTASVCQEIYDHSIQVGAEMDIKSFDFWKEPEEPVFHFYEVYESDKAFTNYYNTAEMRDFLNKVEPLAESEIGMTLYEIKDGKIGVASIAFGPKGEGGLEDATGAGGAGGAGYQQTSKTVNLIKTEEEKKKEGIWGIKLEFPWLKKKDN
jgi:quinol monooxygenase YgiN